MPRWDPTIRTWDPCCIALQALAAVVFVCAVIFKLVLRSNQALEPNTHSSCAQFRAEVKGFDTLQIPVIIGYIEDLNALIPAIHFVIELQVLKVCLYTGIGIRAH